MRVQNHIPIKAVAIKEEDGLEIGTEYDVEDIMMGQSNTSVELVGVKGTYNSISFKFMLNGREIDIFRSPLINPYMKFNGNMQERSRTMIKTWFKEYEKIKDKAVVVYPYEWDCMSEKQRNKILSKKTVIMSGESVYACKYYEIIGNANNLSDHDCAIIADGGNLCFGYRMEGQRIVVYTD